MSHLDDLADQMKQFRAAVIGHPIAHSRSPLIHNTWLAAEHIEGTYGTLDILPKDLAAACTLLRQSSLVGVNATLPHKELLLTLCDDIDETARQIGAVNTVHIRDGELYGTNTDAFGFMENLRQGAPDFDLQAGSVMVLGAGGAARAVLYGLRAAGVTEIILLNRTAAKAQALAADFPGVVCANWDQRSDLLGGVHVLVNTTSLGMKGQPPLEIDVQALPSTALVTDLVYNPLETDLLRQAQRQGCHTVGGLGMLVYQAQKAFEVWFGVQPTVTPDFIKMVEASL